MQIFFIIGSNSETQCLAAIEACLCSVPIIMKETGFVTNLTQQEKNDIGIIGENLELTVEIMIQNDNKYKPREIAMKYFSIESMIKKWIELLDKI